MPQFIGTIVVLSVLSFLAWGAYAVLRVRTMRLEAGIGYALGCIVFFPVTTFIPGAIVLWLAALLGSSPPPSSLFGPPSEATAVDPAVHAVDWLTVLVGLAVVVVTFLSHGMIAVLVRYLARGSEERGAAVASLERLADRSGGGPAINVTTNVQSPQHAPAIVQQQEPSKQIIEAVAAAPPAVPPARRLPQWVGEASRDGEYRTVAVEAASESEARRTLEAEGYFVHQLWPDVPQLPPPR